MNYFMGNMVLANMMQAEAEKAFELVIMPQLAHWREPSQVILIVPTEAILDWPPDMQASPAQISRATCQGQTILFRTAGLNRCVGCCAALLWQ